MTLVRNTVGSIGLGWSLLAASLHAQASVTVLSDDGTPLRSARVEWWTPAAAVGAARTDSMGVARLPREAAVRATSVLVRRLGFAPGRAVVDPDQDAVVVRLSALGSTLPAMTIASGGACRAADDNAAREAWTAASALYRTPSTEGRWANLESLTNDVDEAGVGTFEDPGFTTGTRGYTTMGVAGARITIARRGYVEPLASGHGLDAFGAWRYPPLHAELSGHFADALFGDYHTFSIVSRTKHATTLRFCPRDRPRSGLEGTLRLDASGAFLDARWTFMNPSRDSELAGGEVFFAPPDRHAVTPLTSASGVFWRRLPSGRYRQSWQRYSEWRIAAY